MSSVQVSGPELQAPGSGVSGPSAEALALALEAQSAAASRADRERAFFEAVRAEARRYDRDWDGRRGSAVDNLVAVLLHDAALLARSLQAADDSEYFERLEVMEESRIEDAYDRGLAAGQRRWLR